MNVFCQVLSINTYHLTTLNDIHINEWCFHTVPWHFKKENFRFNATPLVSPYNNNKKMEKKLFKMMVNKWSYLSHKCWFSKLWFFFHVSCVVPFFNVEILFVWIFPFMVPSNNWYFMRKSFFTPCAHHIMDANSLPRLTYELHQQ